MDKSLVNLFTALKDGSKSFKDVIEMIETNYQHQPTAFRNGETYNAADQNQGSAKVFSFAKLKQLNEKETLTLFAEHYQAVLANPEGMDHQNIRQFMANGWSGIVFEGEALAAK